MTTTPKSPDAVTLTIVRCEQCPHHEIGPSYSLDGFDRGNDWVCKLADKQLAGFVERPSEAKAIVPPSWCPLRAKKGKR